ncbi:MAG: TIGR02587 family membrane protein [Pyrinomonadaceae bacterium MAG19_C2-C3]|nr:TIGR02587 family membrane protein [Pyrinomonadaceae bacterium MAG19_C2-C3]
MHRSIADSTREYARGIAGGLLFSLPLLYTMEMWFAGLTARPARLIGYVLVTYVLLLGYNRYAGLREDASFAEVAIDSVEEMGLGLVIAAVVLWLCGRLTGEMTNAEIVNQIVVEAMTVAIGVSVGTAQLGGEGQTESGERNDEDKPRDDNDGAEQQSPKDEVSFSGQLVIAMCGAVLFAANVAPTEEILVIAIESSPLKLLGLSILSLVFGALILTYSEFRGADKFVRVSGARFVLMNAFITYAVALLASALILWFFGRFDGESLEICVAQTVVLGVAGAFGASAGRLLLQAGNAQ